MNCSGYEELFVGQSAEFTREVTVDMMQQFCAVSGDNNPLHVSADFARAHGFQDRVVYGMLTASLYSCLAGEYLPESVVCCKVYIATFCIPYLSGIYFA